MRPRAQRTVIATHLILVLYGHWAVNDPRGSGSTTFLDLKFAPLGPIHFGRKPNDEQPSREEIRAFHQHHSELLNFPIFWIDDAKRSEIAAAIEDAIRAQGYTCYACAICGNHIHLVIRTHKHNALTQWANLAESTRQRLRLRFANEISPHHPVISARPYKVFLYSPQDVHGRIRYIETNPLKEGLPAQHWPFVTPYDNWPLHKQAQCTK
jgi:REP element-mobilizing transposase RayT